MSRNNFFRAGIAITLLLSFTATTGPLLAASKEEIAQKRADACKMANETLARLYKVQPSANQAVSNADALAQHFQTLDGEAKILQSWQGDYPVAQLNLLPEKQREQAVGFIDNVKTFEGVWKAFNPVETVPKIDFKGNLVLFARNTQFYNPIRIGKVNVTKGVAEVLAMETMSAMPIQDKVAMSLAVVPRKGIQSLRAGEGLVVLPDKVER